MSDQDPDSDAARWGRPLRKRPRGPKIQPASSEPGFVGPVDRGLSEGSHAPAPRSVERESGRETARHPQPVGDRPDDTDLKLRDLVAHIARGIVDHQGDVEVQIPHPGRDAAYELRVHRDDLGHVIGKQGRTARSLRLALGAAAAKQGRKASLEIAD